MLRRIVARVNGMLARRARGLHARYRMATGFGKKEVNAFWHAHGAAWAREDASPDDLARISDILASVQGLREQEAATQIAARFREVWNTGFSSPADAWGWDEMNDRLPDTMLLSFARGAAEEHRQRRGS
jgi:hypothetical protein